MAGMPQNRRESMAGMPPPRHPSAGRQRESSVQDGNHHQPNATPGRRNTLPSNIMPPPPPRPPLQAAAASGPLSGLVMGPPPPLSARRESMPGSLLNSMGPPPPPTVPRLRLSELGGLSSGPPHGSDASYASTVPGKAGAWPLPPPLPSARSVRAAANVPLPPDSDLASAMGTPRSQVCDVWICMMGQLRSPD